MHYIVNEYWLGRIWYSIGGRQNIDDHPAKNLDLDNEDDVNILIRDYLLPDINTISSCQKERLKSTFRYALNIYHDLQLERCLKFYLPPFCVPRNIRLLYQRIWKALFNEDYRIQDLSTYIHHKDFNFSLDDGCTKDDDPSAALQTTMNRGSVMLYIVNEYWLDHLWNSIGGGGNVDEHPAQNLDLDNEDDVNILIRDYLLPDITQTSSCQKERIKATFRYALNVYSDEQLERCLQRCLPPFDGPKDIRLLYQRIWKALFNEDYRIQDLSTYIHHKDFNLSIRDGCD